MKLDKELIAEYNAVVQQAQTMTFLPRASDLQEAAVRRVDDFLLLLTERKAVYVQASEEDSANRILAMEVVLGALRAELSMWLKLKQENPDGAWNDLVTAQELLRAALAIFQQVGADVVDRRMSFESWSSLKLWCFRHRRSTVSAVS